MSRLSLDRLAVPHGMPVHAPVCGFAAPRDARSAAPAEIQTTQVAFRIAKHSIAFRCFGSCKYEFTGVRLSRNVLLRSVITVLSAPAGSTSILAACMHPQLIAHQLHTVCSFKRRIGTTHFNSIGGRGKRFGHLRLNIIGGAVPDILAVAGVSCPDCAVNAVFVAGRRPPRGVL